MAAIWARPGLVERRDLAAALDRASEKRVTVITAPAGSGKTTLLRSWAERQRQERRIAFLSVKPGQDDAQLFWLALLGAVRAATGGDEPSPTPGFNGRVMVDRVLAELAAPGTPLVLIIDDLHELTSTEANEQLTDLFTKLPPNVHAVAATRRYAPLRLHQLRLAGELAEIRREQLRFTVGETSQLLDAAGMRLSDAAVATLHERTEGWAAGLRLAILSLAGHPDPARFVGEFSGSNRGVAEYLMSEMLDRQPPEVKRLLVRTSLLDRVNGQLADLLTGATGSERILLDLEDANAFVVSLDPDRSWFRYHHLFRDLLRLELRRDAQSDIPGLHRSAARWLVDHGSAADAIRHLQAAAAWADAAQLLSDHAVSLTLDGQAATVTALLRAFPRRANNEAPGLALVHAIAELDRLDLDQAEAHLAVARAYAATRPPEQEHRLRIAIASLDLLSARLRGHFDGVYDQVSTVLSRVPGESDVEITLGNDLRIVALLNLGVTEAWSQRLADSERHLAEGAARAREAHRPYLEVACLAHLGFAAAGNSFAAAKRSCRDAIALAERHEWGAEPVIAPAYAALAGIHIWTGEFDAGAKWLARARQAAPAAGEPGLQLVIHLIAASLPAARGQYREALAELHAAGQVQAQMVGQHALTSRVVAWTIATQARLGDVEQARADLAALGPPLAAAGEIRNAAAVLRLAERDPEGARRELAPVVDGIAPVQTQLALVEACLLDALACRDLSNDRATWSAVDRALDVAEPDRLIYPFAMTGASELLADLPPQWTAHAALIRDILDTAQDGEPGGAITSGAVDELSPAELRVLRYLPTNLTRFEIAGQLSVSLNTVNTHIRHIYLKLGATDRSSAVQRGRELRLLSTGRA